jgi:hypothetical protein
MSEGVHSAAASLWQFAACDARGGRPDLEWETGGGSGRVNAVGVNAVASMLGVGVLSSVASLMPA